MKYFILYIFAGLIVSLFKALSDIKSRSINKEIKKIVDKAQSDGMKKRQIVFMILSAQFFAMIFTTLLWPLALFTLLDSDENNDDIFS